MQKSLMIHFSKILKSPGADDNFDQRMISLARPNVVNI